MMVSIGSPHPVTIQLRARWWGSPAWYVGAGNIHSMAVGANGELWLWGDSEWAQVDFCNGTGHWFDVSGSLNPWHVFPQLKTGLAGPVSFATGGEGDAMVEINDGTSRSFWGWGVNNYGQLGPPSLNSRGTAIGHEHIPRRLLP
jgi:alpha-tubulin suppressor-like RCC1 family protein